MGRSSKGPARDADHTKPDEQRHTPPNWPREHSRLVAFADEHGVLCVADPSTVKAATFPRVEREERRAVDVANWERLEVQRMAWGAYEFRRAEEHNLDAWIATEDVELDGVIDDDLRRAAKAKRDGTLLDEMAGNMAAVYRHMNGEIPEQHRMKIRPPRLPINTVSTAFVKASTERARRTVRVEKIDGLLVGATVELDTGRAFEESTIEEVDATRGTITMRMQKAHAGRWVVRALPIDAPLNSVRDALMLDPGLIGVGRGRGYDVAADKDEDLAERRRTRALGRLPTVTRVRESVDGVTRYASAGGFLPVEYMPAKQSNNGSTGGARGQERAELSAEVHMAIRGVDLGVLERRILSELDSGTKGTAAVVADLLNAERDALNEGLKANPFTYATFTAEERAVREHGAFDAAEVLEVAREARAAVRRELEKRGLMRPKAKELKPRVESVGLGMPLTVLS